MQLPLFTSALASYLLLSTLMSAYFSAFSKSPMNSGKR